MINVKAPTPKKSSVRIRDNNSEHGNAHQLLTIPHQLYIVCKFPEKTTRSPTKCHYFTCVSQNNIGADKQKSSADKKDKQHMTNHK